MDKFKYWLFESYRRKKLDKDLLSSLSCFKRKVLDIGAGRERGLFQYYRTKNWTIVDIDKTPTTDIVASVENLPFKNNSFETIKATDLFGYVENPFKGIEECFRVLKKGGYFVCSVPYMTAYDNEQHDSQRFTEYKLKKILKDNGFKIVKFKQQGFFFTVWADLARTFIHRLYLPLRYLAYLTVYPILDLIVWLEANLTIDKFWKRYTSGFFIIARK